MEALEKISAFIENLETRTFYRYLGIILGVILLLAGGIIFRYYRAMNALHEKLEQVNDDRQKVQDVLTKLRSVEKQRESVDRILDEKEPFYLLEYFQKLTNQLGIRNVKHDRTPKETTLDDRYTENELNVEFPQMDMQQLTKLLEEMSLNKRIYTKSLEITKIAKQPKIEVKMTIGTLIKKSRTS
jgi:hypothetical protein